MTAAAGRARRAANFAHDGELFATAMETQVSNGERRDADGLDDVVELDNEIAPQEMLEAIWGTGWHSLSAAYGRTDFHTVGVYNDVRELLDKAAVVNAAGANVWFGVHPMAEPPARRGGNDDVSEVRVLVADLDWKADIAHEENDRLPTEVEVRAALERFPHQPSFVVYSGFGLHGYWLLDHPVPPDVGAELTARLHGALAEFGLDVDCGDLAAVLRVPGSQNHKLNEAVPVIIEQANDRVYVRQYLEKRLPAAGTSTGSGSGFGKVRAHGLDKVLEVLTGDGRDQDADAVRVLCEHYGGHHPYIAGDRSVLVCRPGKTAGTSASIGYSTPGVIVMFSSAWHHNGTTFQKKHHYIVGADGTSIVSADAGEILDELQPLTNRSQNLDIPVSWSDAHVGATFGETLAGRWLYCRALGGWLQWDGRRWLVDPGEAVFEEFRQWIIALGDHVWRVTGDGGAMKQIARYRERGKIDAAVTIARRLTTIAARADEFDTHPHLLNVHNGVVDLRTGDLGPHDPALRIRQLAGADYRPDATHPDIDAVAATMSTDVAAWVQLLLGSAAVGTVVDDIVPVFDGGGANGKTTLLRAAQLALGDYATPASTRLLIARATHDEHPTLIADLFGRRLVYIEETPEGGALKMEQLKALSGGTEVKARFIAKNQFTFTPTHQFVVATNHRPAVNASDYAAWRRLRLIPFPNTYRKPHEARPGDLIADLGLRGRLTRQPQREAALAWIIDGAVAWHHHGLGGCAEIDQATDAWRRSEDVIEAWWADCVTVLADAEVGAASLYRSYTAWCETNGRRPSANKEFVKRLTDHDLFDRHTIERVRAASGYVYRGLWITSETTP